MSRSIPALFICFAFGLSASCLVLAADTERTHVIEPEDYFSIGSMPQVAVSPAGKQVVWLESRWDKAADGRNDDLWLLDLGTGEPRRLTFDPGDEGNPAWSPDGKQIYFTAGYRRAGEDKPPYDGMRQVWRIGVAGGEPLAVTRVGGGIDRFDLSNDGKTVYYTVLVEKKEDDWKALRESHGDLDYGHGIGKRSQLFKLDLDSWRSKMLLDTGRVVTDFEVALNGRIAMVTSPDEERIHNEGWSRIDILEPGAEQVQVVTPEGWRDSHHSPYGWINEVVWSGSGDRIGFSVDFDGYPTRIFSVDWNRGKSTLKELPRPEGVTVEGGTLGFRGDELCFIGDDHARFRVYTESGKLLTPGDIAAKTFHFSKDGKVQVVVAATLTTPPDLFRFDIDGNLTRLTRINPQVDGWKIPQISLVQWEGDGGDVVEGVLELPPDYRPEDGPIPMVVMLHGGPTSATPYQFRFWIYGRTLLPARGIAVFSPNYRGSTGYGDKFLMDLVGRENDIDVKDILTGVDALVQRGIADPDRLGVMGWSNGGFLTNCLITVTDRFKAASSGAGVIDQVLQWGTEDTPGHVINFMEGNYPWSDPSEYRAGSPLFALDKVTTPTLIHVGGDDPRVPAAHSRALYRGLKYYVKVPTELVVYPGADHGLTTWKHRLAKMEWDLAWFDRYLLGKK